MLLVLVLACVCVRALSSAGSGGDWCDAGWNGHSVVFEVLGLTGSPVTLRLASQLGDFLITQTLTAPLGPYANITRSSGLSYQWPEKNSSQHDVDYGTCTSIRICGTLAYYVSFCATSSCRFGCSELWFNTVFGVFERG